MDLTFSLEELCAFEPEVYCPFFIKKSKKRLICESCKPGQDTISFTFNSGEECREYINSHCCTKEDHLKCEQAKLLYKYYDEFD